MDRRELLKTAGSAAGVAAVTALAGAAAAAPKTESGKPAHCV